MAEWFQSMAEWFWPRFDPNKCKLYLKSAVVRMNLKKKKGQEQNKLAEKEISELVKQEKDEMARLRVEQLVREQRLLEAYDVLELFCEIVVTRLQLINMYPEIPDDLAEAVHTLTWASLRVAIPELKQVANQFKLKYGEEFLKAALDNTSCYVNEELMEKLSVCCPEKDFVEEEFFRLSPVPDKTTQLEFASFGQDGPSSMPPMPSTTDCCPPAGGAPMPMLPSHGVMPPQQPLPQPQYFSTAPAPASTYGPPPQPTPTVIPPYVPPDLDFGDWSSPLGPSAFPHLPGPAPSHQAPPGMPAPAIGDVFGHIDPSLQFPPIPTDNPDPAFVSPTPPTAAGDEEFDELSARFEALKRNL
jgi:vacuolar protein sorting-associated protein IST1